MLDVKLGETAARHLKVWGVFCIVFFAIHAGYCLRFSHPAEALWVCHAAAAAVGLGLLLEWPTVTGVGALCLFIGTPLWAMDLILGATLAPTSILTHGGGMVAAAVNLPRVGVRTGIWWKATLFVVTLQAFCRQFTPQYLNVNAAFEPYALVARFFPDYRLYLLATLVAALLVFYAMEFTLTRYLQLEAPRSETVPPSE